MSAAQTPRAVAIGGGTGLPTVLRALRGLDYKITAIVTMADDGGSSGKLRREMGILPPGDARNCLVALADRSDLHADVFQYRFESGDGLTGHALGNLVIAALTDLTGDFAEALRVAGEWLHISGSVLPSTTTDVTLSAVDRDGNPIDGQAVIANNPVPIESVLMEPADAPAHPDALAALAQADLVVIGPGSLFTSIIPNFLVDGMARALRESPARRVYVCNVANQRGETSGMNAADHVQALLKHGLQDAIDVVVVHDTSCGGSDAECVGSCPESLQGLSSAGLEVVLTDLADPQDTRHHSIDRLAFVLGEVL